MGMDKSGTQALAASQWVKLTVFTVRTGFPGTSLVDSTLVMDGPAMFFTRPLSAVLLALSVLSLAVPAYRDIKKNLQEKKEAAKES